MSHNIEPGELARRISGGTAPAILDVRSRREFARGHVPGAISIPFFSVSRHLSEIPATKDDEVVVYCGHGPRAMIAAATLRRRGFTRVALMAGHWGAWRKEMDV